MMRKFQIPVHLRGVKAHPGGGQVGKNGHATFSLHERGLTLIEMLVVIAIMSVVGVLILTIFTSTLKGSNKSQIIGAIKQNGQAVLENMDKTIRNADNVVCTSGDSVNEIASSILVVVKNGVYTRYKFIQRSHPTNNFIAADNPVIQQHELTCQDETYAQFENRVCTVDAEDEWEQEEPSLLAGLSASSTFPCPSPSLSPLLPVLLTDSNPQTGVSVDRIDSNSRFFDVSKSSGSKDIVTVQFKLGPGKKAPASITGQIDLVSFQTSIQLR